MSEQKNEQLPTANRRGAANGRTSRASKAAQQQASITERPKSNDLEGWKTYWESLGQPWRTEPEIPPERQQHLAERRLIMPDIEKSIYPFKGIRLDRADLEWLLATHESGGACGPVDWTDEHHKTRKGIDLCGADLSTVLLASLPLARANLSDAQMQGCYCHGVQLQEANLSEAQMQRAIFSEAQMQKAICNDASLQGADFSGAQLQGASFVKAQMQQANLSYAQTRKANFYMAQMEKANLRGAQLQEADFWMAQMYMATLPKAQMQKANLPEVQLESANLLEVELQGAILNRARLQNAILHSANLQETHLFWANLRGANLINANLRGANLQSAQMQATDLRGIFMDVTTKLDLSCVDDMTCIADTRWNGVPLTQMNWDQVSFSGDEWWAKQSHNRMKEEKSEDEWLKGYQEAVRAYRQLATTLRGQGLNEEADRFSYRANLLQRVVLRLQKKWFKYLASWFFWLIAGYGYRPVHSVIAYLLIIFGFMGLYLLNAQLVAPHLTWDQALVLSVSSFHGRGFFEQDITLGSGYARLAATEAVLGLLVEVSFIATFTQRFFGK